MFISPRRAGLIAYPPHANITRTCARKTIAALHVMVDFPLPAR
jgi:hypothetical protein